MMKKRALAIACVVLGLALVVATIGPPRRLTRRADLQPLLLRPVVARTVSKPFLPLLIDLYWLRTLNAIGLEESIEKNRALYDYGRTLIELDPRFYTVYTYVGLNVTYRTGRTTWVNADLAEDMFKRGIEQFPRDMRLHLYLGYTLYYVERKYKEASAVFLAGSKLEGAPGWMAPLAARLLSTSGEANEALAIARKLLDETTDEQARAEFEKRIAELEVEVVLQQVDAAIQRFVEKYQQKPASIDQLVAEGLYRGPLVDPSGGQVYLDKDGRAFSTSLERRYEVYE